MVRFVLFIVFIVVWIEESVYGVHYATDCKSELTSCEVLPLHVLLFV